MGGLTMSRPKSFIFAFSVLSFALLVAIGLAAPALAVAGGDPNLELKPDSLNFGPVVIGTTSPAQIVTATNISGRTIHFFNNFTTPPFVEVGNTCDRTLGAGQSCHIDVACKPERPGPVPGALVFVFNPPIFPPGVAIARLACNGVRKTPTPTPTATTSTASATPTTTATATPTATASGTPTASATATTSASATATPTATVTATNTATSTPTATGSGSPTASATATTSATATPTATATSATPTKTATATATATSSATATSTSTASATNTATATATATSTRTATATATSTGSSTP